MGELADRDLIEVAERWMCIGKPAVRDDYSSPWTPRATFIDNPSGAWIEPHNEDGRPYWEYTGAPGPFFVHRADGSVYDVGFFPGRSQLLTQWMQSGTPEVCQVLGGSARIATHPQIISDFLRLLMREWGGIPRSEVLQG